MRPIGPTRPTRPIGPIGPIALGLLLAAATAHAQPSLIDQLFERHVHVKSAASPSVLHLLYERKADPQAQPSSRYRRYAPGKGWLGEEPLTGAHRCVAFLDNALYVFRRDTYSVYRTDDWAAPTIFTATEGKPTPNSEWRSHAWPLSWAPESACTINDALWVFGVETQAGSARLRAARLFPKGATATERGPTLLGKSLPLSVPASDLAALAQGTQAMVFWHQDAASGTGNEVWRAGFDGAQWTPPQRVPVPYANSDYTVAEHEGHVWLVCKARGQRLKTTQPLVTLTLTGETWGEPAQVPGALDPRLDWTLDIDAASFDGTLFVFRACMDRVVAHRWSGGQWREPEVLFQLSPWPTYLFWWLLGNVALCVMLLPILGFVALRVRMRPRLGLRAFGTEVRMASWARRVAAQLVDTLLTLLLYAAAIEWLNVPDVDIESEAGAILGTVAISTVLFFAYFLISEALAGQTFGKLLLRIAVVTRDGNRPPLASIVARNLLRPWPFLVPAAYLLGSLVLLLTHTSQRLGDLLAHTYVVDLPPPLPSASRRDDE